MWAPELKCPKSIIVRELQLALYKLQVSQNPLDNQMFVYEKFKHQLSQYPDDKELPATSIKVDREFVRAFCDKETWMLPTFWFEKNSSEQSFPGRPSIMAAILNKLNASAEENGLEATLAEQARMLHDWTKSRFPTEQVPTVGSIENGIRNNYKRLKNNAPKSTK